MLLCVQLWSALKWKLFQSISFYTTVFCNTWYMLCGCDLIKLCNFCHVMDPIDLFFYATHVHYVITIGLCLQSESISNISVPVYVRVSIGLRKWMGSGRLLWFLTPHALMLLAVVPGPHPWSLTPPTEGNGSLLWLTTPTIRYQVLSYMLHKRLDVTLKCCKTHDVFGNNPVGSYVSDGAAAKCFCCMLCSEERVWRMANRVGLGKSLAVKTSTAIEYLCFYLASLHME